MSAKKNENVVTLTGIVEKLSPKKEGNLGVFFFLTLKTVVENLSLDGTSKIKEDMHEIIIQGPSADQLFSTIEIGSCITVQGKRIIRKKIGENDKAIFSTGIIAEEFKIVPLDTEHKNSIVVSGEVVSDPIQGKSKSGNAYLFFNVSTVSTLKNNDEKKTVHNIQLWGKSAVLNKKKILTGETCKVVGILKTEVKNSKAGYPIYCSSIVAHGTKIESASA